MACLYNANSYGSVQADIPLKALRTTALHNEQCTLCAELKVHVESTHPTGFESNKISQIMILREWGLDKCCLLTVCWMAACIDSCRFF